MVWTKAMCLISTSLSRTKEVSGDGGGLAFVCKCNVLGESLMQGREKLVRSMSMYESSWRAVDRFSFENVGRTGTRPNVPVRKGGKEGIK